MKLFYVRDNQGNYSSSDAKVTYALLKGKQIFDFFECDSNRTKVFVKSSDDEDPNEIWFEVDPNQISIALQAKRREQYVREQKRRAGIEEIPLDSVCYYTSSGQPVCFLEILDSGTPSPEEIILKRCERDRLIAAVKTLEPDEQHLIWALFLQANPISIRKYAEIMGTSKSDIHREKERIIKKLRKKL